MQYRLRHFILIVIIHNLCSYQFSFEYIKVHYCNITNLILLRNYQKHHSTSSFFFFSFFLNNNLLKSKGLLHKRYTGETNTLTSFYNLKRKQDLKDSKKRSLVHRPQPKSKRDWALHLFFFYLFLYPFSFFFFFWACCIMALPLPTPHLTI